jgi:transcriptional regulator with XRE-family HTH domain
MSERAKNAVLWEVRRDLGLLQREIAERAGITTGYVNQIERGTRRIGPAAAVKIWQAFRPAFDRLGFTIDDLLDGGCTKLPHRAQIYSVGGNPNTRPAA